MTDHAQLNVRGGVPVRNVAYSEIVEWHAGEGEWGFTLFDKKQFDFVTREVCRRA